MSRLPGGTAGGAMFGVPGPTGAAAYQPAAPAQQGLQAPGVIGGNLPFQAGAGALGDAMGGGIGGAYTSAYNAALAQNQAMYNNILSGYQQTGQRQQAAQQQIQQGYGQLQGQVLGDISGIGASQQQAIQDVYAQQVGQAGQDLANRGLGNTTVGASVQRGLTFDEQKAQIALANQMAQLTAGYRSQLGLAGLGFQNQANLQNTALAGQQLNWMNTVTAAYPNAGDYERLLANQAALSQQQSFARQYPLQNLAGGYGGLGGGGRYAPQAPANLPYMNWAAGSTGTGGGYGGGVADQVSMGAYQSPYSGRLPPDAGPAGTTDALYAGTAADYQTDPNAYSPNVYQGYDLSGIDYGAAMA